VGELQISDALVTGSNGKTTTVRLLAACAEPRLARRLLLYRRGVLGARRRSRDTPVRWPRQVVRECRARCAIVETARGGILRRGIALSHAQVALVTTSARITSASMGSMTRRLADVKLSVAGVVTPDGLLVLNADDPQLCESPDSRALRLRSTPGWFALDATPTRCARIGRARPDLRRATRGSPCSTRAPSMTWARSRRCRYGRG